MPTKMKLTTQMKRSSNSFDGNREQAKKKQLILQSFMQRSLPTSDTGKPTWESTILTDLPLRKASRVLLSRCKQVHRRQGFTKHVVQGIVYNIISTRRLASYLLNHFLFVCGFLFPCLTPIAVYTPLTFQTLIHAFLTILRSFGFVSLHFVLLCLLHFLWREEHALPYAFRWLLCPRGSEACPSLLTVNANKPSVNRQLQHPSKRTTSKNIVYLSEHKISPTLQNKWLIDG